MANSLAQDATTFGHPIHPDVGKLAKLGTSGEYVGDVRRDALRAYKPSSGLSLPLWLTLPYWGTKALDAGLPQEMPFQFFPRLGCPKTSIGISAGNPGHVRGWRPSVLGLHA